MSYSTPSLSHLSGDDFTFIYEPAEDTFLFLDALEIEADFLKEIRPLICLEIGSGSGCVSSFMAAMLGPEAYYICTDISVRATSATKDTGIINGHQIDPIVTDLVKGLLPRLQNYVDVLLFNPPYVVTKSHEVTSSDVLARSWAGGKNGREVIDRLLPLVPKLLSSNGIFYLVAIHENHPKDIEAIMFSHGFKMEVVLKRKAGIERLMVLRFKKIET